MSRTFFFFSETLKKLETENEQRRKEYFKMTDYRRRVKSNKDHDSKKQTV
jgi:hypothetical protein